MNNNWYIAEYLNKMVDIAGRMPENDISNVIDILFEGWKNNRQIFIMGNGGSASTATHFVCDLSKGTIIENKKRFRVIGLTDNIPLMTALVNDNGFENLFYEQLRNLFNDGDIVIGISVHGGSGKDSAGLWSQNLLKAMKYVQENGGIAIGFSGFDGGAMKEIADICVTVPVDSTPHVESLHVALEHLICNCLREKIREYE